MVLDLNDDDSDSKESDTMSLAGEDTDLYINHYRIPKLLNYGPNGPKNQTISRGNREQVKYNHEGKIMSLTELAAQNVACHLPFGQVEHFNPPVPEPMQRLIAFWSFPQDEEDIRLYTCLANGNADVFIQAEDLISLNCVCDMLQVGFHLSAKVKFVKDSTNDLDCFKVAITFDRRRMTSCSCSCSASTFWCQHTVAVCLQRIRKPQELILRTPVSESLQRLSRDQLIKFSQYLINELPQQILPAAQKLLDELLSGDEAIINKNPAAPDPTAGATINEQTNWCLDDSHLKMDIQKILLKQCTTQPTVCSDIQTLHLTAPPASTEYSQLLRPIRGREPEGLWNLISIVAEMMKRQDSNYFLLLEIMTREVLRSEKVVTWWFETKVSLHSGSTVHWSNGKSNSNNNNNNSQSTSQYSCSNFCDQIAHLWRLAAMDPSSSQAERKQLYKKFFAWHLDILRRHSPPLVEGYNPNNNHHHNSHLTKALPNKRNYLDLFPGFKLALEGCLIDWSDWDDKRFCLNDKTKDAHELDKSGKSIQRSKKKKKKKTKKSVASSEDPKPTTSENASSDGQNPPEPLDDCLRVEEAARSVVSESEAIQNGIAEVERVPENRPEERSVPVEVPPPQQHQQQQLNRAPEAQGMERDLLVYFMDRISIEGSSNKSQKPESLDDYIKVNMKKLNDPLEIIYSKAEGLYAHGHLEEAKKLALKAANIILNHPCYPSLKHLCTLPRRKKKGSLDNQMSIVASEALTKISFLANVLLNDVENHNVVFRLLLFGIEMKRSPAATKPLEVKLINQKHDLIMLLKSITLHEEELIILRERAQAMRDVQFQNNSNALTFIILGSYIFEALVLSKSPPPCIVTRPVLEVARSGSTASYNQPVVQYQNMLEDNFLPGNDINPQTSSHAIDQLRPACSLIVYGKTPSDTTLGFNAALNALSVKLNLLEADHPLLCEGTRRQRGELALSLLTHYKDDQEKLDLILKHLLDKDIILAHQMVATGSSDAVSSSSSSFPSVISQQPGHMQLAAPQNLKKALNNTNNSQQDPNQPTEASAHFMFELAKTVFDKAGGNSNTAHLFRPQLVNQNGARGIHRKLHMCSLRIALYALGLQNRTSANWMQRTYNGRASFIHDQAIEIGLPAIKFLCENWHGYLTPVEAAVIADKAGSLNDAETKRVAAEMAKSCLKYAHHLEFNIVRRIFFQCREQNIEMIEEACSDIEQVAESENVSDDVLFATARAWYNLYDKLVKAEQLQLKDSINCPITDHQHQLAPQENNGVSHWHGFAEQHQPFYNDTTHAPPIHWDPYGRSDFIPTLFEPTYKHIEYVKAAYRVGIKALEASKPALQASSKHNPQKESDILWLLLLSKILGRECLLKFIRVAIKNITDHHILRAICTDLINFFGELPADHQDRLYILFPLIDKCLDRFVKHMKELMKPSSQNQSYDQRGLVESILDEAQKLTDIAYNSKAKNHFKELLRIVDNRKLKKNRFSIEMKPRLDWVNEMEHWLDTCNCDKCRVGRINYLT